MANQFYVSPEYARLKDTWEQRKVAIVQQLLELKASDPDKVIAAKVRALVADYKALLRTMEDVEKTLGS